MDPSFVFEEDDGGSGLFSSKRSGSTTSTKSGDDKEGGIEPAWELGEAITEAKAVKHKTKTFSTTDEKIRNRLQQKTEDEDDQDQKPTKVSKKDKEERKKKKKEQKHHLVDNDDENYFSEVPKNTKFEISSFLELNLSRPLCKACAKLGYENPTPIQVSLMRP